jgi:peptidoglycan/xylan/chitin deacetylase (PgdA/CDA1 family)
MRIPIYMYHEITSSAQVSELSSVIQSKYIVETVNFEKHLKYLSEQRYRCVTVSELCVIKNPYSERLACITFDDGYEGNYVYALPLLKKYGFKATFFITTGWVGKNRLMNWEQVRQLLHAGMEIGSHTKNHVLLGNCDEKTIQGELEASKNDFTSVLGIQVRSLSFPSGSYSSTVLAIARKLGYQSLVSSDFGYYTPVQNKRALKRLIAENSLSSFVRITNPGLSFLVSVYMKEAMKSAAKLVLGRWLYDRLYFRIFNLKLPVEG